MADRSEATAGRAGWVLIENEGALFRGPGRGNPMEVWNPDGVGRPMPAPTVSAGSIGAARSMRLRPGR
jgi:hypothetical protein